MNTATLIWQRAALSTFSKRARNVVALLALMTATLLAGPRIHADSAAPAVVPESSFDKDAAPESATTKPELSAEKPNIQPDKLAGTKIVEPPATPEAELGEKWGISVLSTRLTAAGRMIDFRYRVLDPEKAARLFDPHTRPYLIDEATGAKFIVPAPPKVGQLRNTRPPVAEKNYFILFANPANYIKGGNKVSVVIGDLKIERLTLHSQGE